MHYSALVSGNKFVKLVNDQIHIVTGKFFYKAYGENNLIVDLPVDDVFYVSTDIVLIRNMVRGAITVKDPLSWWYAYKIVLANVNEYFIRHNYLGRVIEDLKTFEKSLASISLETRTKEQGQRAAHLMERLWHSLPDSVSIHSLPRFNLLCDLCSEACVFQPDEEDQ